MDDFSGSFCGQGKYPLVNGVKNYYGNGNLISSTTSKPTDSTSTTTIKSQTTIKALTDTTTKITTQNNIPNNLCFNGNGYYPDLSTGCKKFYVCVYAGSNNEKVTYFDCPSGLLFDKTSSTCNFDYLVSC